MRNILTRRVYLYLLVFITGLVFRSYRLTQSPSGFGSHELDILYRLFPSGNESYLMLRFISVLFVSFATANIFLFILRVGKNEWMALAVSLVFILSPWSFMLSRSISLFPGVLLCISLSLLIHNKKLSILAYVITLATALIIGRNVNQQLTLQDFSLSTILKTFDFHFLFFTGEQLSITLKIPRTGFFLMTDLPALLAGLMFLSISLGWKKYFGYLSVLLCFGILYYHISNISQFTFGGIAFLTVLTIIIGIGYYYVFSSLFSSKFKILMFLIAFLVLANALYYQELFYNHFDKKNSTEWGYANIQLVRYLNQNNQTKKLLITSKKEDVQRFTRFFKPDVSVVNLPESDIAKLCRNTPYRCILKEEELSLVGLEKEKIPNTFYNKGGLPEFFLL